MAKLSRKQVGMLQEEFVKAGIMRDPNSYTADELKDLCPNVPHWFIDDHVAVRDGNKKQSDYKKIKIDLNKF